MTPVPVDATSVEVVARRDWMAEHLAVFLTDVSSATDDRVAAAVAVARATELLTATGVMVTWEGEVLAEAGLCTGALLTAPLREDGLGSLTVARAHEPFSPEEILLVNGMARVIGMTLRLLRLLDDERAVRHGLQERQHLLERLFKIQRSISARQPIATVLDTITQGAAELLGDDVAVLRLLDESDAGYLVLWSAHGIPDETVESARRTPVGDGVGGRAVAERRLIVSDDYAASSDALPPFVAIGMRVAMAAPVYRDGVVVGSLLIGSYKADRRYSLLEQEMLLSFAEHVSLALNDSSAVDSLNKAYAEAIHQATHDGLTGLPKRTLVLDRLDHALARARRDGGHVAAIFVDLDRFKTVNDSLGHSVGDEVLIRIAERLLVSVRPGDTVGRLAGDEFLVLCEDLGDTEAVAVARRLATAVAEPFSLYGRDVSISASIGIALASPTCRAEDVLRDADVAMYRAKERGRARIEIFDESIRQSMIERLETEQAFRRAIVANQLCLHYQPIVDVQSGKLVGTEALVRWNRPGVGLVYPDKFIPLAEEGGLIVPLGRWVVHEACRQLAAWRESDPDGLGRLAISVNLSAKQFGDPGLVELVADALHEAGVPAAQLSLEITESVLMDDAPTTVATLGALRALGVRLAIDDFGTGYSSLSYLKRFPVELLKIDRSFVDGLCADAEDEAIVTAVVWLAKALSLSVVAEGCETKEQLDKLRVLGCNYVQGYLFGKPQPPEDLAELARTLA